MINWNVWCSHQLTRKWKNVSEKRTLYFLTNLSWKYITAYKKGTINHITISYNSTELNSIFNANYYLSFHYSIINLNSVICRFEWHPMKFDFYALWNTEPWLVEINFPSGNLDAYTVKESSFNGAGHFSLCSLFFGCHDRKSVSRQSGGYSITG